MKENELIIRPIDNPNLLQHARILPNTGVLKLSSKKLLYLDIDDRFVHNLCPLLNNAKIAEPDYFSTGIGAHISVIYPNEIENPNFEFGALATFEIDSLFSAETKDKIYFIVTINSTDLLQIRISNKLAKKLNLNGLIVDMHTTLGVIKK